MAKRLLTLLLAIASAACAEEGVRGFDWPSFALGPNDLVAGFDLRVDARPSAGLVVPMSASGALEQVLLPFDVGSTDLHADLQVMVGSYPGHTLLGYRPDPTLGPLRSIAFTPRLISSAPETFEDPEPGAYFWGEGQRRTFAYVSADAAELERRHWPPGLGQPTIVAVAIPVEADRLETDGASEPVADNGIARFFQAGPATATSPLVVRYVVPLTTQQELATGFLIRLFGLLLPGLIGIVLIDAGEVGRPRARRWIIGAIIAIELLAIGGIAYFGLIVQGATGMKLALDGLGTVIGGLATAGVLWVKIKPAKKASS